MSEAMIATQICPICGFEADKTATICPKCGKVFRSAAANAANIHVTVQPTPNETHQYPEDALLDGLPVVDVAVYVGNNSTHYTNNFRKYTQGKWYQAFNWAAALLSVYWLCYRKMYLQAVCFTLSIMLLTAAAFGVWRLAVNNRIVRLHAVTEQYESACQAAGVSITPHVFGYSYGSTQVFESSFEDAYPELVALQKEQETLGNAITRSANWLYLMVPLEWMLIGFLGDYLYWRKVRRDFCNYGIRDSRLAFDRGGTSGWGVLLGLPMMWVSNAVTGFVVTVLIGLG